MTATPNQFDEDLILGYVEGELSGEQKREFEAQMLKDPRLRNLVAQLVLDRKNLQAMPDEPAPADLMDVATEHLERRMLLGADNATSPTDAAQSHQAQQLNTSRFNISKWLGYSSIAALVMVSAGLVFLVIRDDGLEHRVQQAKQQYAMTEPEDVERAIAGEPVDAVDIPREQSQISAIRSARQHAKADNDEPGLDKKIRGISGITEEFRARRLAPDIADTTTKISESTTDEQAAPKLDTQLALGVKNEVNFVRKPFGAKPPADDNLKEETDVDTAMKLAKKIAPTNSDTKIIIVEGTEVEIPATSSSEVHLDSVGFVQTNGSTASITVDTDDDTSFFVGVEGATLETDTIHVDDKSNTDLTLSRLRLEPDPKVTMGRDVGQVMIVDKRLKAGQEAAPSPAIESPGEVAAISPLSDAPVAGVAIETRAVAGKESSLGDRLGASSKTLGQSKGIVAETPSNTVDVSQKPVVTSAPVRAVQTARARTSASKSISSPAPTGQSATAPVAPRALLEETFNFRKDRDAQRARESDAKPAVAGKSSAVSFDLIVHVKTADRDRAYEEVVQWAKTHDASIRLPEPQHRRAKVAGEGENAPQPARHLTIHMPGKQLAKLLVFLGQKDGQTVMLQKSTPPPPVAEKAGAKKSDKTPPDDRFYWRMLSMELPIAPQIPVVKPEQMIEVPLVIQLDASKPAGR